MLANIYKSFTISESCINLIATAVIRSINKTLGNTNGSERMDIIVPLELPAPETEDTNVNTEDIPKVPKKSPFKNNEISFTGKPNKTVKVNKTTNVKKIVNK